MRAVLTDRCAHDPGWLAREIDGFRLMQKPRPNELPVLYSYRTVIRNDTSFDSAVVPAGKSYVRTW